MVWTKSQKKYRSSRKQDPWFQKNLQKTGFTTEQKEALCYLIDVRHMLHQNQDEMARGFREDYWAMLPGDHHPGTINIVLYDSGLPTIPFPREIPDHFPLTCREEECRDYLEQCNTCMEWYLRTIDSKYGTRFAPTGASRRYREQMGGRQRLPFLEKSYR